MPSGLSDVRSPGTVLDSLIAAELELANFRGANLRKADLGDASLFEANLTRADLGYCNLEEAELLGADLEGAHFWDTLLEGTITPEGWEPNDYDY